MYRRIWSHGCSHAAELAIAALDQLTCSPVHCQSGTPQGWRWQMANYKSQMDVVSRAENTTAAGVNSLAILASPTARCPWSQKGVLQTQSGFRIKHPWAHEAYTCPCHESKRACKQHHVKQIIHPTIFLFFLWNWIIDASYTQLLKTAVTTVM